MSDLNIIPLKVGDYHEALRASVATNVPLVVLGPPGCGKTQMAQQFAPALGYQYTELLLAGRDIGDVMMPFVANGHSGPPHLEFHYNPAVPYEGNPNFDDRPILLNIDEFSGANRLMQNVLLKVLDERRVGEARLRDDVRIMATGNRALDMAHVEQLSAALANRATIITLQPDLEAFIQYGIAKNFHPLVVAWVKFDPDNLFSFDDKQFLAGDHAFASPRSNERLSNLLHHHESQQLSPSVLRAMICGNIGQARGIKFYGYLSIQKELPDIQSIVRGTGGIIPKDPSVLYATLVALVQHASTTNLKNIVTYVKLLDPEWQAAFQPMLVNAKPKLQNTPAWGEFCVSLLNSGVTR